MYHLRHFLIFLDFEDKEGESDEPETTVPSLLKTSPKLLKVSAKSRDFFPF